MCVQSHLKEQDYWSVLGWLYWNDSQKQAMIPRTVCRKLQAGSTVYFCFTCTWILPATLLSTSAAVSRPFSQYERSIYDTCLITAPPRYVYTPHWRSLIMATLRNCNTAMYHADCHATLTYRLRKPFIWLPALIFERVSRSYMNAYFILVFNKLKISVYTGTLPDLHNSCLLYTSRCV